MDRKRKWIAGATVMTLVLGGGVGTALAAARVALAVWGERARRGSLPALFDEVFGKRRKYGQQSHDRYTLDWSADLPVAASWREFVGEVQGPEYRRFLTALFGTSVFDLRLHWHYTPTGCSVSPHCRPP